MRDEGVREAGGDPKTGVRGHKMGELTVNGSAAGPRHVDLPRTQSAVNLN